MTKRIRVLHSVGHLSRGGIESWLYDVVRRLDPARYEHHVLVWTREEEAFTAEFRAAGVLVHALPAYKRPLRFAMAFRRLVRTHGPFDVLHTHGTQFHGFVLALGRGLGIPARVAHSHTDIVPVLRRSGRVYRAYAAAGHGLIRRFATAGRGVSEVAAVSMFGPKWRNDSRWGLLFCGIDLERFAQAPDRGVRGSLGIPDGRTVLGHVGRFETQKNHVFLVELLAALVARGTDAHLLLVGDGTLRDEIGRAIAARGLAPRCTVLPDCRDVPRLMSGAMDAFVLSSLYEGLPLVLVEAQAAGLPCLVSEGAAPEATVLQERVRRLPLTAGVEAWAQAVGELPPRLDPRDPAVREALRQCPFALERSVAAMDTLYRQIAEAKA